MFGLISKSAIPDAHTITWVLEVYRWLLAYTGGFEQFRQTPLVLPNEEFFAIPQDLEGEELAQTLFELTKANAGLSEWPCVLVPHTDTPSAKDLMPHMPVSDAGVPGAAGTFAVSEQIEITYSPRTLEDPINFVATMAHELSHYLMATIPAEPPGGREAEEPATDICAIFLGYGIFAANSAFQFSQFQDGNLIGWSTQQRGYLSEQTLAYGLAVFLELLDMHAEAKEARRFLDANPRAYLKHALRDLRRRRSDALAQLRATTAMQPT